MTTEFPYIKVPAKLLAIVGEPDPGTRIYRAEGSAEDSEKWHDALYEISGSQFVSPGGVTMFANVSRAAVYKRMKEGRLTCFLFHITTQRKTLFGGVRKLRESPYGYIPVSECKAWQREMEEKAEEREKVRMDSSEKWTRKTDEFLQGEEIWKRRDKKKR